MNENERKIWDEGHDSGVIYLVTKLLKETDKVNVILALFRKADEDAEKETDPQKRAQLEAYSEGFRHSANILKNYGDALSAYHNIVNPGIKVEITADDVKRLNR